MPKISALTAATTVAAADTVPIVQGGVTKQAAASLFPPATAWTVSTPTVTSGTGTLTTASSSFRYIQMGKTVHFSVTITITTNGTGATSIVLSSGLPVAAKTGILFSVSGRANSISGKALIGIVNTSTLTVFNYDNTYPAASGEQLILSGVYETN